MSQSEEKLTVGQCDPATPRPWQTNGFSVEAFLGDRTRSVATIYPDTRLSPRDSMRRMRADAALIVHAVNNIERLEAENAELRHRLAAQSPQPDVARETVSDVEIEAALNGEGIHVYGPDAERFERMFATVMRARAALSTPAQSEVEALRARVGELEDKLGDCADHLAAVLFTDPGPKMHAAMRGARLWWYAHDRSALAAHGGEGK